MLIPMGTITIIPTGTVTVTPTGMTTTTGMVPDRSGQESSTE